MGRLCLGFDTSNYTTSAAVFDGDTGANCGKLLTVPEGTLGLRQSDALFQHTKRLHLMMDKSIWDSSFFLYFLSVRERRIVLIVIL